MVHNPRLNNYTAYVKLTVVGESAEDALEYASEAIDASDMLTQDGVIGIELIDDIDSIELIEAEEDDYGNTDEEDY
jgi:hypothetical protein